MATYVVTAPAVQVVVEARVYFLERGASVPEGVAEDVLAHLVGIDYITEVEAEAPAEETEPETVVDVVDVVEEKLLEKLTKADLTELATAEGVDLAGTKTNADIVAAIYTAREAKVPEEPVPAGSVSSNL